MRKNNCTISETILSEMRKLHSAGIESVTRTILWKSLKKNEKSNGFLLKRASLSSCITSLIVKKKLIMVPVKFDVQHFRLPKKIKVIENQNTTLDKDIELAAEILLSLKKY